MNKKLKLIILILAVVLSVFTHLMIWKEFYYPTFGNTNIHVASARDLVEAGSYPLRDDYSYGGGVPNLYVPTYRFISAQAVFLTGLDFDITNRLLVMLFAVLLPIGYYLLGKELFNETTGLFSALLVSFVPEMLIYTVRPLPQAMGLALLPFAFWVLAKQNKKLAWFASLAIVWVHQEAGVFFVASVFAFAVFASMLESWNKKKIIIPQHAMLAFQCWFIGVIAYFGWHYFLVGNINILELAQFKYHEGGVVTIQFLFDKTGLIVLFASIIGILASLKEKQSLLAMGILAFGLFAIKNDLIGLQVFMDRFVVFLQIALILFAGFAFYLINEELNTLARKLKDHQEPS